MIVFSAFVPHPPILLPTVGSESDHMQVQDTLDNLQELGKRMRTIAPDAVYIAAPHPDWGFNVPLYFLLDDDERAKHTTVHPYLIGTESPAEYREEGAQLGVSLKNATERIAVVASGDLSHRLTRSGPYGYHEDGPAFDAAFREALQQKDIATLCALEQQYPDAGACGLRPLCFVLGILEGAGVSWSPDIRSYEGPFGVGYAVVEFRMQ